MNFFWTSLKVYSEIVFIEISDAFKIRFQLLLPEQCLFTNVISFNIICLSFRAFIVVKISSILRNAIRLCIPESIEDILTTIREVKPEAQANQNVKEDDIGEDVIARVNEILARAFILKASDIHV